VVLRDYYERICAYKASKSFIGVTGNVVEFVDVAMGELNLNANGVAVAGLDDQGIGSTLGIP